MVVTNLNSAPDIKVSWQPIRARKAPLLGTLTDIGILTHSTVKAREAGIQVHSF